MTMTDDSLMLDSMPAPAGLVLSALDATERRESPRRTEHCRVIVRFCGYPPRHEGVWLRDLSDTAAGFIVSVPLPLGFRGHLILGNDQRPVPGSVMRCRPLGGGWYEGAFKFDRVQPQWAGE
jgi:hypothetical protein